MKHLADRDIGRRAAEQIRQRGSIKHQIQTLGVGKNTFYEWESGGSAPGAYALSMMARQGYDVIYILTGQTTAPQPKMVQGGGATPKCKN